LVLEGDDVELDKSIIEGISDPLTHLVRNAADHGLELPDLREGLGKPRKGTIELKAYHEDGYVKIDISDDGSGIDVEKLITKLISARYISKEDSEKMTEQEILELVFRPGVSTAEKISDISGRGVGMDVVKSNIEKLGGNIELITKKGYGTKVRLILPLTIAIIQALILEVGNQRFAISQMNLSEVVRIKNNDPKRKIEIIQHSEVLRLRDKLLPIVRLSDILEIKEQGTEKNNNFEEQADAVTIVLILQVGTKSFGLVVDKIFGSEEILIKPLPSALKSCDCYSGVTIMGDGKIAMILDLEGVIKIAELKFRAEPIESKKDVNISRIADEQQNLLLFQCTGNEIYGLDLSLISRVERIMSKDIEYVGSKEYIKFMNQKFRIIHPEYYLPVNKNKSLQEKKYLILPMIEDINAGILAEKIIDNICGSLIVDDKDEKVKGITGTIIYNNIIVQLINIYELYELAMPELYSRKRG
jgi:two-component system chemotaxis sensor kinase CheA